eukprot:13679122-Heterocapsa_arctica.AAC.1
MRSRASRDEVTEQGGFTSLCMFSEKDELSEVKEEISEALDGLSDIKNELAKAEARIEYLESEVRDKREKLAEYDRLDN